MLHTQHTLHLLVAETSRQVDSPVAEPEEQPLRLFVATVYPRIAQTRIHLVQVVEGCPRAVIHTEVALLEVRPYTLAVRHTAYITLTPLRMVPCIRIGTLLQFTDHIFHPLAALLAARSSIHRHRGEVVTTHMAVQSVPVGIGLGSRFQSCFLAVGCQQPVAVILQQSAYVQVVGLLQRTVQQGYIAKGKLVAVQLILCISCHNHSRQ